MVVSVPAAMSAAHPERGSRPGAATVQLIYVHPKARGGSAAVKLLRALRRWATEAGAADLHINNTTAIDAARTDRFLRKMGFRQTGGNSVLERV